VTIFKREIGQKILRLATEYPAVVLTGARQVGKTTLLRTLFPDHHWVSLDLPSVAEQADTDPQQFLAAHPAPAIIDEVQYAPQLFRHLKVAIDTDRHHAGRYLLTGSQKFTLMKEVADSLAGRAAILNLETLSLAELGDAATDWSVVLARGQFPELWRVPAMHATDFYASYVASYLERDVRQIVNVRSLRDFERFLRATAARSGQLLNLSDLARDVGIKPHTAREWLGVLEASNQCVLLEPYFENVGKRLVKSPKLYWADCGLLCFLLGLDARTLERSPLLGAIWETFVFAELRKQLAVDDGGAATSLWFYRDSQGREVDFLRVGGGKIDMLDAKWSAQPDERWHRLLRDVGSTLGKPRSHVAGRKLIVCRTAAPRVVDDVFVTTPRDM
jgi:predicted AAA+ superfamily ATPase